MAAVLNCGEYLPIENTQKSGYVSNFLGAVQILRQIRIAAAPQTHCGSGLVREEASQSHTFQASDPLHSRTSPLPQILRQIRIAAAPQTHCGSGLVREEAVDPTHFMRLTHCIRGSRLPQKQCLSADPDKSRTSVGYSTGARRSRLLLKWVHIAARAASGSCLRMALRMASCSRLAK